MLLKEFLEELKKISHKYQWTLYFISLTSPRFFIRAYKDGKCYCPITAVLQEKYNYYCSPELAMDNSNHLGLSFAQARAIINTTDGCENLASKPLKDRLLVAINLVH